MIEIFEAHANNSHNSDAPVGIIANWLLDAIKGHGLSLSQAEEDLGLTPGYFAKRLHPMPLNLYKQLFEWAAQVSKDSNFGLSVAEKMAFSEFGLFGYLVANSPSVRSFFLNIDQYLVVLQQEGSIKLHHSDTEDCVKIHYHSGFGDALDARQDIEFTLAMVIKGIRHILNQSHWHPQAAFFMHSESTGRQQREFFGDNITCDYAYNAIAIEKSALDVSSNDVDLNLLSILSAQAMKSVEALTAKPDIAKEVHWLITSYIGQEGFDVEQTAKKLGITRRTLHRRLQSRGTSFRAIKHQVVKEMAMLALIETDAPITDIALQLGFSEISAFSRSFKRLTGTHPLQFRKNSHNS